MLDQNTDRMWYVIGAVLVGAAIILIANGSLPQMFASVAESFEEVSNEALEGIAGLNKLDESYILYGETRQSSIPYYDNPSELVHKDVLTLGSTTIALPHSLKSVDGARDKLYFDSDRQKWMIEQNVKELVMSTKYEMNDNSSVFFKRTPDKKLYSAYISSHFKGNGKRPWKQVPIGGNGLVETVEGAKPDPQSYSLVGIYPDRNIWEDKEVFNNWLTSEYEAGTPVTFLYELLEPKYIELDESMQSTLMSHMR